MNDNLAANLPPVSNERKITVDAQHFTVRFLVPVLALLVTIAGHFLVMALVRSMADEGLNAACIALPVDVVVFLAGGHVIERLLQRALPSRRHGLLSDDQLVMLDERQTPPQTVTIAWDQKINVLAWRFMVRRRTRVPKGWYCLALRLLQDEEEIILYTFMDPEEAERLPGYDNFVRLRPRRETESNSDLSAVAMQRRLLKLEDARWDDGAEISQEDFQVVVEMLQQHVPAWR